MKPREREAARCHRSNPAAKTRGEPRRLVPELCRQPWEELSRKLASPAASTESLSDSRTCSAWQKSRRCSCWQEQAEQ